MTAHLVNTPVLQTERLTLRAPVIEDYPVFEAFVCSERSHFILSQAGTPAFSWRALASITGMWALRGFGSFVFCDKTTGSPLGLAGPWYPMNWPEREIGWSVWTAAAEGKGYAAEAASAARRHAYKTLSWKTAVSYINRDNARSIALAKRLGCTIDPSAAAPGEDDLVYRHPSPEALL